MGRGQNDVLTPTEQMLSQILTGPCLKERNGIFTSKPTSLV